MPSQNSTDAVLIGGGIAGMCCGYHLAEHSFNDIVILERDTIASKASGRAAGIIFAEMFGKFSVGTPILDYCRSFHDKMEDRHTRVTIHNEPTYTVAHDENSRDRLLDFQEQAQVSDPELIGPEELSKREPVINTNQVNAALDFGKGRHVDPYSLTMAVADEARARGVDVNNETVTNIKKEYSNFVIETNVETYKSPILVNTAGAWSHILSKHLGNDIPLAPRPSEIAVIRSPSSVDFPMLNCPDLGVYVRQEPNGDIIIGSGRNTKISDPDEFSNKVHKSFHKKVARLAPQISETLSESKLVNSWAGLCSATPNGRPLIGETSTPGFYLCTGFNGGGIMHAPFAGRLLAELVADESPQFNSDPFDPLQHTNVDSFSISSSEDW